MFEFICELEHSHLRGLWCFQDEMVEEKMLAILPADCLSGLDSSNWKERLANCEKFMQVSAIFHGAASLATGVGYRG